MQASCLLCWSAYLASLVMAVLVVYATDAIISPLWAALLADVAATAVVFVFSLLADNSSVYDAYWAIAPSIIYIWLKHCANGLFGVWHIRQLIALMLINAWALRFHVHLPWDGWRTGLMHEDWRYAYFRPKFRTAFFYWSVLCAAILRHACP